MGETPDDAQIRLTAEDHLKICPKCGLGTIVVRKSEIIGNKRRQSLRCNLEGPAGPKGFRWVDLKHHPEQPNRRWIRVRPRRDR